MNKRQRKKNKTVKEHKRLIRCSFYQRPVYDLEYCSKHKVYNDGNSVKNCGSCKFSY